MLFLGTAEAWAQETAPASPNQLDEVKVTARRKTESAQKVPIAMTVVDGEFLANTGAFNVNRLKEVVPTLQFYSTNPRNSAINIRGLGAPYGLTNDGLEPGVGLYIDGVFFARPAAATLDFIDVERIEVLRGPQGTLYGKNTTAGAINVTTRKPSFTPETQVELSYGNYGFIQAKASTSGPLSEDLALRLSFSGTQRDGLLYNVKSQDDVNDLNNIGFRGQLLWNAAPDVQLTLAGDYTRQRPEGYTQVVAGVAPTKRAANRQYAAIIKDLNYVTPSYNAFDRITDVDSPIRSYQDLGGVSLTTDWTLGSGNFTAISAWRFWDWNPSNDRDFIGLPVTTKSAATSVQRQVSEELRYAASLGERLDYVVGLYGFSQTINSDPVQTQEQGAAAYRFLLAPSPNATPALLDGYGQRTTIFSDTKSAALFAQLDWDVTDKLSLRPGLRLNYDEKSVDYNNVVYGGTATNAAQVALQRSVLAPQAYKADVSDTNVSGQLTASYTPTSRINTYATYARGFKTVGLNTGGVPTKADGVTPAVEAATVKPESVNHYEVGIKTQPLRGVTANLSLFQTDVKDYQAQVQNASVGVLRGYLANANKVQVRGVEFDGRARLSPAFTVYAATAYTDGKYVSFPDAPPSLENTGGPSVQDISGERLPGISKWAASGGGEYTREGHLLGREGYFFGAMDVSYRSEFSSSATPSAYLNVPAYDLFNARVGFRAQGWDAFFWVRNLTDRNYYELLSAAPGGSGLYVGQPGDPRTWGMTLRAEF